MRKILSGHPQYVQKNSLRVIVVVAIILVINTVFLSLYNVIEDIQKRRLCTLELSARNLGNSSLYNSLEVRVRRLPQAIIIGTRKSGTRALLKFLEINPSIRAASKEVHFFDRTENYEKGLDWYKNQMPESSFGDITIEKSPAYFVTKEVPERIHSMNSSIKLILIFRDPVTRLISDFSQLVANGIESGVNVDEKVYNAQYQSNDLRKFEEDAWEIAKEKFHHYVKRPDGGIDEHRRAIKTSMYSVYLERWKSIFPKNQLHFVDGESLIKNPYPELARLETFLGLKQSIKPDDFIFDSKKGFYCLFTKLSDRKIDDSGLKLKKANGSISCLSRSKGRRHVVVEEGLIEELQKFFEPYNEYLYSLTSKNFNWTKAKQ